MSKAQAIKIILALIEHKKFCIENLNQRKFTTDIEDIRQGMVSGYQNDKELLEIILSELNRKYDSRKK